MKIIFKFTFFFFLILASVVPSAGLAASDSNSSADLYFRARVLSVNANDVEIKAISGPEKGKKVVALYEEAIAGKLKAGDVVVVDKTGGEQENYFIVEPYRINQLILFVLIFFAVAIYFGRRRGVFAIIGLIISILIIFYFLIPQMIAGKSPLATALIAALLITITSLFVAHGVTKRTTVAFAGTVISLGITVIVDLILVYSTKLTGNSSEEAMFLQLGDKPFDLQSVLLAGILIGVLGILDDITTAQAACVEEIHAANPTFTRKELYRRGLSVGREHIASLVNTIVLVYVGVSLPLILLFVSNKGGSLWVVMNSGFIAEEIVRTLVGSLVLVIAVPLTTFLAAYYYSGRLAKGSLG